MGHSSFPALLQIITKAKVQHHMVNSYYSKQPVSAYGQKKAFFCQVQINEQQTQFLFYIVTISCRETSNRVKYVLFLRCQMPPTTHLSEVSTSRIVWITTNISGSHSVSSTYPTTKTMLFYTYYFAIPSPRSPAERKRSRSVAQRYARKDSRWGSPTYT